MKRLISALFLLAAFIVSNTHIYAYASKHQVSRTNEAVTELNVNGLKVLVKRRSSSPTVALGLFVRGGVRNYTSWTAGIESMTLSAAAEGSKSFPRSILRKELARTGSSIGAGSNRDFSVMSLASTRQNFERSWKAFADVVMNPSFAAEDVELVRERMLTALRDDSDTPESVLASLEEKSVYTNHLYSNSPRGTLETISRLKAEELQAYHKKVMQTSQLLLVVVGDVDPTALQGLVSASIGRLPQGSYKQEPISPISFAKSTLDVSTRSLQTNYVQGVFSAPSLNNPDYAAMRVAVSILASRVFQEVRVKNNLSYAPSAEMNNMEANTANISVTAVETNRAVGLMLSEIEKLKSTPVEKVDILETGGFFLTTYYIKQETNAAQAAELAVYELIGGGWQRSGSFLDKIRAVTPADVQRVSKTYMNNIRFAVVGDPNSVDRKVFLGN